MLFNDCLKITASYLEDDELLAYANGNTANADQSVLDKVSKLKRCADIIASEIFTEYVVVKKSERIKITNGSFPFSSLSSKIVKVYSLTENGKNVDYKILIDGIQAKNGEYVIEYSYAPSFIDEAQNTGILSYTGGKITERVIALGMASEYCLMTNRYNDALSFDETFKYSLVSAGNRKGRLRVKERSWL